jgi:hypothetical protein
MYILKIYIYIYIHSNNDFKKKDNFNMDYYFGSFLFHSSTFFRFLFIINSSLKRNGIWGALSNLFKQKKEY